jgi:hypothetical protein
MITPTFDHEKKTVNHLSIHYRICSLELAGLLRTLNVIDLYPSTPSTLVLNIGNMFRKDTMLPLPLDGTNGKVRIARDRQWIEYDAPIAQLDMLSILPSFLFEMHHDTW